MKQSLSRARVDRDFLLVAAITCAIAFVSCGQQPRRSRSTLELTSQFAATVAGPRSSRLNINTASATEMEKLPGVSKIVAERVVAHRQQYGRFRRIEHLMMVRGFSDHKFRALRELITVE